MPRALSAVSTIRYSISGSEPKRKVVYFESKRSSTFGVALFLSILFIGTFIFYLYLNVQLVEANFNLKDIEKKLELSEVESQNLEAQIGETLSMKKLQEIAKESNLEKAQDIRFVELKTPGSLSMEKEK